MQLLNKLLEKYNQPVPRYTSYPPANYFTNQFGMDNYSQMLTRSNLEKPEGISLYIHIPFCTKICLYCGCNTFNISDKNLIRPYIETLKKEISMISSHLDKHRQVTQIHYGGGTPNAISDTLLQELNNYLFDTFNVAEDAEIAIEAHPAYLNDTYIKKLSQARFNRFSIGIQDFNNEVLKLVNRQPSIYPVNELMEIIKSYAPQAAINLDFIYGLPLQTTKSFCKTIEKAIKLTPDRLVTFSYAHVPWIKKQQKVLESKGIPSPKVKLDMFLEARNILTTSGYRAIGLDHYVKPTDELNIALNSNQLHRNFQGYATRRTTGQVYAIGASAISQTESGYAQNAKEIKQYIDIINKNNFATVKGLSLTTEQIQLRTIITHVMCNKELNWSQMAKRLNTTTENIKGLTQFQTNQFEDFAANNLLEITPNGFTVTKTGSIFIRNIAAALDPTYQIQKEKYSQSV